MKITIEIKNCQNCPNVKIEPDYYGDSWDRCHKWLCKANKNKIIERYISWNEENKVEVPGWCPCKK